MNNSKSFIALSFIREVENPYEIFCKYIEYSLSNAKDCTLTYDKLLSSFQKNSGLNVPNYIFSHCLKIMQSNKSIIKINNNTQYKLIKNSIDIKDFETRKKILENQEDVLINNLIEYVQNEFNKKWDYKKAQNCITNFLLLDDNTYSIFTNSESAYMYNENTEEWILKSYIKYLKENKNKYYDYLLNVINGLATYIGILYTDPTEKSLNIENTDFYLDTKLILRYLGYTTEVYTQSINQLVDIIRNNYKGNICVFKHTISEVSSALYNAYISLLNNQDIEDNELRMYKQINKIEAEDFKIDSESVEYELEQNNIRIQEQIQWEDSSCWINSINSNLLFDEIKKHRKVYKKISIDNDVNAMNQINMLRNGDYSVHFGGNNKLPIIVTNNTLLIKNVKDFILKDIEDDFNSVWKINKMPIISDTALMCKLWASLNEKDIDIPELLFSKNAYSILSYDDAFYSNLKERSVQLKERYNRKVLNLSNERLEKIEKLIIKNNNGNFESLSDNELIYTIDESYELDKITLEETIKRRDDIIREKDEVIANNKNIIKLKEEKLIAAYSEKYLDNLGINFFLILFGKYWWIVSTIIFTIISYFGLPQINLNSKMSFFLKTVISLIPLIFKIIIELLKKISSKKETTDWLNKKCLKIAQNKYKYRIKNKLTEEEKDYQKQIVDYCINNSKYFKKDTN